MTEQIKELIDQDRKVYYIDVDNIRPDKVIAYLEKIKEEFAIRDTE